MRYRRICWREDKGADNEDSDWITGPNNGITLAEARYNYLKDSLYNPERKDLMKKKAEEGQYLRGRVFEIIDDEWLIEKGTNWQAKMADIGK
ncbi:hypothetical protein KRX19_01985 [Cardiobacteriaceae bacterium TAE3-ERU3]|nr:hypothetical protein [Cardiobacteriaceae bacterium TAE3-ERU3]